jgi:hypothetical protein
METETIVEELEQTARQLGFEIRSEKGNFQGGRCTVDGDSLIVLNKRHVPERRLAVLARALRDAPLDSVYLKPAVRQALEDVWADQDARAEEASHADS